jgi:hypothetical protein
MDNSENNSIITEDYEIFCSISDSSDEETKFKTQTRKSDKIIKLLNERTSN